MNVNHRELYDVEGYLGGRHHQYQRTPLHSRPRTRAELERRTRLRWVLGAVISLGLAVVVGLVIPT
jgi:hypothetical protein